MLRTETNTAIKSNNCISKEVDNLATWREMAKRGDASAQCYLGLSYMHGYGVQKSVKHALEYYSKAATQNNAIAQYMLGAFYISEAAVIKDYKEAVRWFTAAAKQGHAKAQYKLGMSYMTGKGSEKDIKLAVSWFNQSAEQNNELAQYKLAVCYERGMGIEKDAKQAVKWYSRSALQGNANAQYKLGICYEDGIGIEPDENQAVKWYSKAAEQGNARAQLQLGYCLEYGLGTEQDIQQAVKWYIKSSRRGNCHAQKNLGLCFLKGIGVEKNEEQAKKWLNKAAKGGNLFAQNWLAEKLSYDAQWIYDQKCRNTECYIPKELPSPVSQVGPYCGIAAFVGAVNYSRCLSYPLYATKYEKAAANEISIKSDIVFEQLKEMQATKINQKWHTQYGEIYNINIFSKLAKYYDIEGCEAYILKEDCTQNEYQTALFDALKENKILVVACESSGGMPTREEGEGTHWVLVPGGWLDDNGDAYVCAMHHEVYAKWSIAELYQSNQQIPDENPLKKGGHLNKFRFSFFAVPMAEHSIEQITQTNFSSKELGSIHT